MSNGGEKFISKALYYLYPWGFSSFLQILAYKLGIEFKDLPEDIKNLSSYIKYGLNNPTSCLARSIGIKSRQVSLFMYEESNFLEGKDFIKWVSNLTKDEIESFKLTEFDKENLIGVSLKLTPNSYRTTINKFEFIIKGTYYSPKWSETSLEIEVGEELTYKREEQNEFDPYAIMILKDENQLGYVPREYAKLISSEIDIESSNYTLTVIGVNSREEYNEINVQMIKTE